MPTIDRADPHVEVPAATRVPRRQFLVTLSGGAAAVGLAACADDGPDVDAVGAGAAAADSATAATTATVTEAVIDTRADPIVPSLTPVADLHDAEATEIHMTYAPEVPAPIARTDQRIVEFEIDVVETVAEIDPTNGVSTMVWGFRIGGDETATIVAPGPVMRARVGDLARITVNNLADSTEAHNIDWHAITGQGGGAEATTVPPGEAATIHARLLYPGAFMYHCAFGDVPQHISHGMYGMFIVDPEEPLPAVDHEWAIMQSEWFLGEPDDDGMAEHDRQRLLDENPTYVTFNGRTDALIEDNALRMTVDERARFYMVNEGLNLTSSFHPIGSHWDVVYPEAATHPINRVIRGSQSTLVVAGGGTVTELVGYVPSTIVLVDHALVRTFYKGCIGQVVIDGEPNTIFAGSEEELAGSTEAAPAAASAATAENTVVIPDGAWDPANAATAYTPGELTVVAGTTVAWRNDDTLQHTVTSGPTDGTSVSPDGLFDSGLLEPGDTFEFTFDEPGTFEYHCTPHPWMGGRVVVTE
ncbi:MAG: plastocyanin/azurin family copper-binding protein [Desertimonas sp.]